jgi:hypothetical protein
MSEYKDLKPKCNVCGGICEYVFTPTVVQFALKDGPSGSWPSKGNRFKAHRAAQSQKMKKRQRDRYGHLNHDCLPNVGGKLVEDWREAQSVAMQDKELQEKSGKGSLEIAATFNPAIEKEKKKKASL